VVAVASGKGGAGTSTVATVLAATMAADGTDVLLVDAADQLGTLDTMLGVTVERGVEALRGGRVTPDELVVTVDEHLALLPSSASGRSTLTSAERRVLLQRVTMLFPRFGMVILDAGASADSIVAACALGANRVLAVTANDRISIAATYALVKLMHQRDPGLRVDLLGNRISEPVARLVQDCVNAATIRFLSRTVHLAGAVPEDPHFSLAIAAGMGARVASQGSSATAVLRDLGRALLAGDVINTPGVPTPLTGRN
jgi:flagellar biosynthesis protein FlhG